MCLQSLYKSKQHIMSLCITSSPGGVRQNGQKAIEQIPLTIEQIPLTIERSFYDLHCQDKIMRLLQVTDCHNLQVVATIKK